MTLKMHPLPGRRIFAGLLWLIVSISGLAGITAAYAESAAQVWNDQRVVGGQLQAESRFLRESGTSRVSALRKHVALVGPDIDARHDIVGTRRAVGRMQEQLARALASRDAVHFSDLRAVNLHDTSYHDGLDNPYRFLWNDRAIQFAVRLHVREELVSGGADAMMRNLVFTERAAPNSDLLLYLELIDTSSGRLVERVAERRLSLQELLSEGAPDAAVSEDVVEEAAGAGLKREVDRLADHLVGVLSGLPFQARIIDVDSDRGYVNIGFEAGLQPGDKLVLYGTGREVRHYTSEGVQVLGRDESIKGSFRLDSVQTRFARGHVEGRGSPEIGDIVREW